MSVYNFTDKKIVGYRASNCDSARFHKTIYHPDEQGRVFRVDLEYSTLYENMQCVVCVEGPTYVYHTEGDVKGFQVEQGSVVILDENAARYVELILGGVDGDGYLEQTFGHTKLAILMHTTEGLIEIYDPSNGARERATVGTSTTSSIRNWKGYIAVS